MVSCRLVLVIACLASASVAQTREYPDLTAAGRDPRWKIVNRTESVVNEKGKHALKLSEGEGMGLAWLEGYDFADGVIDIDILGRSQPIQGSFVGIAFRILNAETHDAVYFRPFNFRAVSPDRRNHAVQYASYPNWPWERLRSKHPGKYEHAVVPELNGDQWFHARIVVEQRKVSVFVNGATTPCLVVNELSGRMRGSLGLWVGEGSGGYFANLRVTRSR